MGEERRMARISPTPERKVDTTETPAGRCSDP
jgi:hypothetical protein